MVNVALVISACFVSQVIYVVTVAFEVDIVVSIAIAISIAIAVSVILAVAIAATGFRVFLASAGLPTSYTKLTRYNYLWYSLRIVRREMRIVYIVRLSNNSFLSELTQLFFDSYE